jgi:hypothetical protein
MATFPRQAKVGKIDVYEFRIDPNWLGTETITGPVVSSGSLAAQIGSVSVSGASVFFFVTGVSVGDAEISLSYSTSGNRTNCHHATLMVRDLC